MTYELTLLSRVAHREREIAGPRLTGLLALLVGDLHTGYSAGRLIEGLWPDERPENPSKALQILVSRARSQLDPDLIANTANGYRLTLDPDEVDAAAVVEQAAASARSARDGDHAAALAQAEQGLAAWDGVPDADAGTDDPLSALRAERAATYWSLVRGRALALARLGRFAEALEPLAEVARDRPRDEELLLELLRSEAVELGPAAALARYETYRRTLRDELGADPGQALQAAYQRLLQAGVPAVRHGVSYEPNQLLGRDDDIAVVAGLLRTSRVVSIVGVGGLGKTRMAHAVSRRAEQRAVYFVGLAGVRACDVVDEVASVLGVGEARSPSVGQIAAPSDPIAGIVSALGPAPALLVLDNCEHVLDRVGTLAHSLVSMTGDLRVLTTSRAPLGLSSESVYLLPELTLDTMVELFTQRATAARPGIQLPREVVAEICQRLDGLPLAVELAAARVRVMSVAEIARRLEDRFSLLRGGPRDTPQRHRALHAVVEWSWNLLDPTGQGAMRTLSVFPSGFTAAAAGHLLGDDAVDVLEQLVEQSLLTVADSPVGTRFRMLETVREFSAAERAAAGEDDTAIGRLLAWARDLGLAHYEGPFGPDPYRSVDTIRAEQDNLGFALQQALARDDSPTVASVAAALGLLWMIDTNFPRMSVIAEDTSWLLSHYRPEPAYVEITRTALALSAMYTFVIEGPRAVRSLVALRRLPPASPRTFAGAVSILFDTASDTAALLELGDSEEPGLAAAANAILSYVWEEEGNVDRALAAALRSLESAEAMSSPTLAGLMHSRIGELYFGLERPDAARRHLAAGLPVTERLGSRTNAVGLRAWLVLANLQLGDLGEAERWLESVSSATAEKFGTLGYDLGPRAEVLLARGDIEEGLRLWRQIVDQLRTALYEDATGIPLEIDPWAVEARVTAVVAHALHGRLDLVADITPELEDRFGAMLDTPLVNPPPYVMELQLSGSMLLALGLVDLDRARDNAAVRDAVRMIALAQRHGYIRNFQPTMASGPIRQLALDADRSAYEDAVSSYADLDRDGLKAAAISALQSR